MCEKRQQAPQLCRISRSQSMHQQTNGMRWSQIWAKHIRRIISGQSLFTWTIQWGEWQTNDDSLRHFYFSTLRSSDKLWPGWMSVTPSFLHTAMIASISRYDGISWDTSAVPMWEEDRSFSVYTATFTTCWTLYKQNPAYRCVNTCFNIINLLLMKAFRALSAILREPGQTKNSRWTENQEQGSDHQ